MTIYDRVVMRLDPSLELEREPGRAIELFQDKRLDAFSVSPDVYASQLYNVMLLEEPQISHYKRFNFVLFYMCERLVIRQQHTLGGGGDRFQQTKVRSGLFSLFLFA